MHVSVVFFAFFLFSVVLCMAPRALLPVLPPRPFSSLHSFLSSLLYLLLLSLHPSTSTPRLFFPTTRPWFSPPSPIAVLTPVRNSSSSLSSHTSSETGNVGSLLILADGMVVEHPEDFYRMQVSASLSGSMKEIKFTCYSAYENM